MSFSDLKLDEPFSSYRLITVEDLRYICGSGVDLGACSISLITRERLELSSRIRAYFEAQTKAVRISYSDLKSEQQFSRYRGIIS